jgi:C_GCAxxG_C_C family probable redox protein
MDGSEKAVSLFRERMNCAQAVLSVFSQENGLDESTVMRIACGFGAGMGRLQETCGAVTGAYMVLGLETGKSGEEQDVIKEKTYVAVRQFDQCFVAKYGTTSCKKLLNCDLNTEEGKAVYEESKLEESVCVECVRDSVILLQELLRPERREV